MVRHPSIWNFQNLERNIFRQVLDRWFKCKIWKKWNRTGTGTKLITKMVHVGIWRRIGEPILLHWYIWCVLAKVGTTKKASHLCSIGSRDFYFMLGSPVCGTVNIGCAWCICVCQCCRTWRTIQAKSGKNQFLRSSIWKTRNFLKFIPISEGIPLGFRHPAFWECATEARYAPVADHVPAEPAQVALALESVMLLRFLKEVK